MCGRYGFSLECKEAKRILRAVRALEGDGEADALKTGEVFPTDRVAILLAGDGAVLPAAAVWGLANPYQKGVIINARAETVLEKAFFRGLRRCVVPTTGFYEWKRDESRQKFSFRASGEMTYLAGLSSGEGEVRRFVILTTAANSSMAPVHDRMPLVLTQEQGLDWLYDRGKSAEILRCRPDPLKVKAE